MGQIALTSKQSAIFRQFIVGDSRFTILRCGRRFGKNYIALVLLIHTMINKPGTTSACVGKTSDSVMRTIYEPLIKMLKDSYGTPQDPEAKNVFKRDGKSLTVTLANGSKVIMKGSNTADSLRGEEIDGMMWCDEIDFHGHGSNNRFDQDFKEVYRPCTSITKAPFVFTSTPIGVGQPFHKRWMRGESDPDNYKLWHFTSYDNDMIDPAEIDDAKLDMSPNQFAQEYMAEFVSASSRVYPHFSKSNERACVDTGQELYIGLDHNVAHSIAIVGQRVGDSLEIIDEILLTNSNTREMAMHIKVRYPGRHITVYPDPAGRARKTSADIGMTDHTILEQEGLRVVSPRKAYMVVDRINTVNNMVYNAAGERRLHVDPKCSTLTEAMSFHLNNEVTRAPMKGGVDHFDDTNDSMGYLVMGLFSEELSNKGNMSVVITPDFYG